MLDTSSMQISLTPPSWGPSDERRARRRFEVHRPFTLVPTFPDGSPDWEHRQPATSIDLSAEGIGLDLPGGGDLPATSLVLVSQDVPGVPHCAGLEVRNLRRLDNHVRVGGRFDGLASGLLEPAHLAPRFHPETMQFATDVPEPVLRKWAGVGVLDPVLVDRVQLCPRCLGLPTFRDGCRYCGSARVGSDRLIHHFACAHVGFVADFEVDGELTCPKCRTRRLVVGADYEYLTGPYRCQDCGWSDTTLEHVAQCLKCGFRFPSAQAHEQELRGYHVHRLDPLALLPAP